MTFTWVNLHSGLFCQHLQNTAVTAQNGLFTEKWSMKVFKRLPLWRIVLLTNHNVCMGIFIFVQDRVTWLRTSGDWHTGPLLITEQGHLRCLFQNEHQWYSGLLIILKQRVYILCNSSVVHNCTAAEFILRKCSLMFAMQYSTQRKTDGFNSCRRWFGDEKTTKDMQLGYLH